MNRRELFQGAAATAAASLLPALPALAAVEEPLPAGEAVEAYRATIQYLSKHVADRSYHYASFLNLTSLSDTEVNWLSMNHWCRSIIEDGNAYSLRVRDKLVLLDPKKVKPVSGGQFYRIGGILAPRRFVVHDRRYCFFHPQIGMPALLGMIVMGSRLDVIERLGADIPRHLVVGVDVKESDIEWTDKWYRYWTAEWPDKLEEWALANQCPWAGTDRGNIDLIEKYEIPAPLIYQALKVQESHVVGGWFDDYAFSPVHEYLHSMEYAIDCARAWA